jgi:hypothetical protein
VWEGSAVSRAVERLWAGGGLVATKVGVAEDGGLGVVGEERWGSLEFFGTGESVREPFLLQHFDTLAMAENQTQGWSHVQSHVTQHGITCTVHYLRRLFVIVEYFPLNRYHIHHSSVFECWEYTLPSTELPWELSL